MASLSFHAARARGSYVRSYQGRCVAPHHPTRYGTAAASPVKVTALSRKRLKPGTYSLTAAYGGSTHYAGAATTKTLKVTG